MLSAVALTLLGLVAAVPQLKPDFTGRWVLRSSAVAPDTARVLIVEQPITTTNVRGEAMPPAYLEISIRREREAGATTETLRIGVVGGVVPGSIGEARVPRTYYETVWEGDTLVFTGGSYSGDSRRTGQWAERREAWTLAGDRTLSIVISNEGSATASRTMRSVYARE